MASGSVSPGGFGDAEAGGHLHGALGPRNRILLDRAAKVLAHLRAPERRLRQQHDELVAAVAALEIAAAQRPAHPVPTAASTASPHRWP